MKWQASDWEKFLWNDHTRTNEPAAQVVTEGSKLSEGFNGFCEELFHRLYATEPQSVDSPSSKLFDRLHTEIEKVPEFQGLRERCVGNDWWAGESTSALTADVLHACPEKEGEPLRDPQSEDVAIQYLESLIAESNSEDKKRNEELLDEQMQAREQSKRDTDAYVDNVDGTDVRNAVRKVALAMSKKIDEVNASANAFGIGFGSDPKTGARVAPQSAKRIAEKLKDSERLRKIADMLGRLRRVSDSRLSKKPRDGMDQISGVTLGNDLARLLPSSAMYAADPVSEPLFASKYLDRSLLCFKLTERKKDARGPVVVLLDVSSSMGYSEGVKINWATAVALSLLFHATNQKRAWHLYAFNEGISAEWDSAQVFPGSDQVMEIADQIAASGGTNYELPLNVAVTDIRQRAHLKKADIVMITDGVCDVGEAVVAEVEKAKREIGLRIEAVLIGVESGTLEKFADQVHSLPDIAEETIMHDLYSFV